MSPLELFRRNQKVTMTFLILLAMFAFVVLPTISQYMQSNGPGMVDPVIAEFNGVSLTASRVNTFTRNHYATVQFLRKLAEETVRRGGTPSIFALDPRSGQIQSIGINSNPSDEMSIRTMQFAAEAQKQGFELDDTSIGIWLDRYTDGKLSERDVFALLRRETNNRMGQYQLYDMLRKQLLSELYFRGAGASVSRGQFPLQSPLDHWNNFLKLNQKATINAYGVLVDDFIAETDADPPESEVAAVYEAGKDRYPSEQSPEPGFRQRETASFEYLLADLQTFRDAEVAKLSDEDIQAEYEKRKAGGAFQLPPEMTEEPAEEMAPETQAEETATEDAAPESGEDVQAAQKKQVEDFAKELEEAGKLETETPADEDQSSLPSGENGIMLVTAQEESSDQTTDQTDPSDQPSDPTDQKSDPSDQTDPTDPTDQSTDPSDQTNPSDPTDQPTDPTDQTNPSDPTDQSTDQTNPSNPSDPTTDEPAAEQPEPRYRPFEEVREQIAQTMVDADARSARDEAVSKIRTIMKRYSRQRALYESGGDTTAEAPERPDLKAVAEELGLSYSQIGPHDPVSLSDEPIAGSVEESTALSQRGVTFVEMMFGSEAQLKRDLFTPAVSVDLEAQQTYVSWKTEEKEAYLPKLDEIRDEVVAAIRRSKARDLAKQAAETMAEKANESTLAELIPDDRKDNYFKDLGPFSWFNMVGFGGFTIGNIPELDSIDADFMETVFTAENGTHVVAPNGPKRVYYVVERTSLLPATADLRAIFSQQSERMMAMFMTDGTAMKVREGFFEAIDEDTGFTQYEMSAE